MEVKTKAGVYLGRRAGYKVDLTRLDRVAARIAKGLFYHQSGARLPNEYEMIAYNESGMANISEATSGKIHRILQALSSTPERVIGQAIFSYRSQIIASNKNLSVWLLTFFNAVAFICISVPKETAAKRPRSKNLGPIIL